jgi:hypothetical protein
VTIISGDQSKAISLKGSDKINYNFIYSKDILTYTTKLLIDRIGLGIGYELF